MFFDYTDKDRFKMRYRILCGLICKYQSMKKLSLLSLPLLFCVLLIHDLYAQTSKILTGRISRVIVDNIDGSTERRTQLVTESGERISLKDFDLENFKTGDQVEVEGLERLDGSFKVNSLIVNQPAVTDTESSGLSQLGVGEIRRAVVIVVNLANASVPQDICSNSDLEQIIYTGTPSTRGLIEHSSRNLLTYDEDVDGNGNADIFGPYTITAIAGVCDSEAWMAEARALAISSGVNFALYQHEIYVFPDAADVGCGWVGLAELGCPSSCFLHITDCDDGKVYVHELGHNLNLDHSGIDSNDNGFIEVEYGDLACPMGWADYWTEFNAVNQLRLNWYMIYPEQVQAVAASGTFTMEAMELNGVPTANPQILTIKRGTSKTIYLSYRKNTGGPYDDIRPAYLNGVNIHTALDTSLQQGFVRRLNNSETYEDEFLDVRVTQDSNTADTVTVTIDFGPDTDGDGVPDTADSDDDNDGVDDSRDCADLDETRWYDIVFPDDDADGIADNAGGQAIECMGGDPPEGFIVTGNGPDNCLALFNPDQADLDSDDIGDACDDDLDNDSVENSSDCAERDSKLWSNIAYADPDLDGFRDNETAVTVECYGKLPPNGYTSNATGIDNCPGMNNADQRDSDNDGLGDLCDDKDNSDLGFKSSKPLLNAKKRKTSIRINCSLEGTDFYKIVAKKGAVKLISRKTKKGRAKVKNVSAGQYKVNCRAFRKSETGNIKSKRARKNVNVK